MDELIKRCAGPCNQEYPATTEFWHRKKGGKYGLAPRCKGCLSLPEARKTRRVYRKTYYDSPAGRANALTHRKNFYDSPAGRAYMSAHGKEYRSRPGYKEHKQARMKAYRSSPEFQEHLREYHDRPEVQENRRIASLKRRAQKKAVLGNYTPEQIQDQLKRQKHKCYYCQKRLQKVEGRYIYHIEHTFPLSRVANTDIPANSIDYIVLACPACNMSKKDKFPWEFPEGGRLL